MATPRRAEASKWFFKTGKGEYGYGDKFLGLSVPQSRIIAKKYRDLTLVALQQLLESDYHEERLIALIMLVGQYTKADDKDKQQIYDFYLSNTNRINNWDLVDVSAEYIVGEHIFQRRATLGTLVKLAKSTSLWERRIAIIATFAFIKNGNPKPTFTVAALLLHDKEDLIQKAVGWMLREVGKRVSQNEEAAFLKEHYKGMPRTMLRYAIERFDPELKKRFMVGAA
jgi:3-methyladenine DNA glycosylase AlkD